MRCLETQLFDRQLGEDRYNEFLTIVGQTWRLPMLSNMRPGIIPPSWFTQPGLIANSRPGSNMTGGAVKRYSESDAPAR
jgi:hypothetical protein